MRKLRYILIALSTLCYRGLSAEEWDLYDFRYYQRFATEEELLAAENADTVATAKHPINRNFSTRALDYNLSMVRSSRRGAPFYRRLTTINGAEVPFIGGSSVKALQLSESRTAGISHRSFDGEMALHIDTIGESRTSVGFSFSSRNTPYSISLATSQPLKNDWSLSANLIAKTGRDLHIDGMFGNSLELNAIATKSFNKRHLLSVALFAKPSVRSHRLASTEEAFRLTGDNLYNPAWGYQNGKVRNSRISRDFTPTAVVAYEGTINERTRLNLTATATLGIERYSSLSWFDAQTPSPDNYRYMPSYFADEEDIFSIVESAWLTSDTRYTQIDFDRLIATNRLNGGEAVYAIADRVERVARTAFHGEATTELEKGHISYGLDFKSSNSRNYKQMRDLLEAEYIIDLDYFLLDDDSYGNSLQNNLATPNRRVSEGDRYGYDYSLRRHDLSIFGIYHYSTARLDIDFAASVGYSDISRRGFYRKELFADNSYGPSRHLKFSPYSLRLSAEYLVGDNHLLRAVVATQATPCREEEYFVQSEYNNRTVANPTMHQSYGGEVQYILQIPDFTLGATLFALYECNDTEVRHLYDDLSGEYTDIVTSKIDRLRYGAEIEAEYRFAEHFRATAALTAARYRYADNALVTIYSDASNILLADHIESKIKGLSLGNMPQIAATAALSYYNKGWWASINANYAALRYIEPSATMRTERVLAMATSIEQRNEMVAQERLRDAFTLDITLSKTLYLSRLSKQIYSTVAAPRFEDKHPRSRLIFRIGVRNLLGSANMVYNAYESSRLQRYTLAGESIYNRQASRYMYAYPRTFYASATFAF